MSARPSSNNLSTSVSSRSQHVVKDSTETTVSNRIVRTSAASEMGVTRRVDRGVSVNNTSHLPNPKPGSVKPVAKPKRPAVSEAMIADWLGGDDFEDQPIEPTATKSAATSRTNEQTAAPPTDDVILARVAERLVERKIASFARIGLDVKSGVITVRGNVASKGERLLLIHVLQTTPGVRTVNDGLILGKAAAAPTPPAARTRSLPSLPALPAIPSMTSRKQTLSSIKPLHAGAALVGLLLLVFCLLPRGAARPVAVFPVKGHVAMEGKPLADATVLLHPVGESKLPQGLLPRGVADGSGNIIFQTFDPADGSPEGEFVATVHLRKPVLFEGDMVPGPDLLPELYRNPETSPFRVKITREIKELSLLELHAMAGAPMNRH